MAAKKKSPSAQGRPIRRGTADSMERRASAASRARTGQGEGFDKIKGSKQYESYARSGGQKPVELAARAIRQRYGNKVGGDVAGGRQSMREFVQSFQDVVAESGLTDKFSSRTLDAAAKKVATQQYSKYVGGTEEAKMKRKAQSTSKGKKK